MAWLRALGVLTVATTVANVFSFGMSLVLSRGLTPEEFGGIAALLALSVVGAIPSQGEQFLAARSTAQTGSAPPAGRAWLVGGVLFATLAVFSAPVASALGVGRWDPLLLGLNLAPLTVLGVALGALLGRQRKARFGVLLVVLAAGRLAAAGITLATGGGTSEFLIWAAVATWATLAAVLPLLAATSLDVRMQWHAYGIALSTVAGVFVLTSIDTIAGRMLLDPEESGAFAVSAFWARVAFWLPQAVALAVFPAVASGSRERRVVMWALGLLIACGAALATAAALVGPQVVLATSGPGYPGAYPWLVWQVVVGTLSAMLQLLALAGLAAGRRLSETLVWGVCLTEVLILAFAAPATGGAIIAVETGVQLLATAIAAGSVLRGSAQTARSASA